MGVDTDTYRCRVGLFVSCRWSGAPIMPYYMNFSGLVEWIGSLAFIKLLLIMICIGSSTESTVDKIDEDTTTKSCRFKGRLFVLYQWTGAMLMSYSMTFTEMVTSLGSLALIRMLLVMAGIETNPGPKEKFIFRLQYVLVEIGAKVLGELFDIKVGRDFARYLASNSTEATTLQSLIARNKITADQAKYLPPIDKNPTTSNFDISLLACLLRNVCHMAPPRNTVWMSPLPTDTSEEAEITRLRIFRNTLMHRDTVVMSEVDFNNKWKELKAVWSYELKTLPPLFQRSTNVALFMNVTEQKLLSMLILLRLNNFCNIKDLSDLIDNAELLEIDEGLKDRLNKMMKLWDDLDKDVILKLDQAEKRRAADHDKVMKRLTTIEKDNTSVQQDLTLVKQGTSTMQQDLTLVKQGTSTMQQHLTSVKQGTSTMQQDLTLVKQGTSTMQQDLTSVKQGTSTMQQDMTLVKQVTSTMQQDLTLVKQGTSTMQQYMTSVKQGTSTMQQDLTLLKQGTSTIQQDLTSVEQNTSKMQQDLTTVKQETSTIQQNLASVEQGLSTMQQDLCSVKDGMSTMQEDWKEMRRTPTEDANDIQQKLIAIYQRDCRLIQVSPFIDDDNYEELMCMYQRPTLSHTVYDSGQRMDVQKNITSFEEIFCKNNETFKRVYITGDAGVGKSSLCRRMCLLWSMSRLDNYAGNDDDTKKGITFMKKFDFLFHVSLGATDRRDMVMMIIDQLFYTECDKERRETYKLIKHILSQHKSLIVLDGYDEWTPKMTGTFDRKTPQGIESEKCVFLTMCRPYKLENVRLPENEIDHQVELSGIHGKSAKQYVGAMVKYMNKKNKDNKYAEHFLQEVRQCGLYDHLCIPIVSSHLIVVWWFNQTLSRFSKSLLYGKILEMMFKRAEGKFNFPLSTTSEYKLPDCFSEFHHMHGHVSLLQKVCLLSFNSLFKQDVNASTLIFTKRQLMSSPYGFTGDEMNLLCKVGIVSRNKIIGYFEDQKQILSFVHKSYIEFFGALFVSSFDSSNRIDSIVKAWLSLDDVLQYENFFQFLAGLSSHKLSMLLQNMYAVLSDHFNLWRTDSFFPYTSNLPKSLFFFENIPRKQLNLLQTIVISCFDECNRSRGSNDTALHLEDFTFDGRYNVTILHKLFILNASSVKSIYSLEDVYYDAFDEIKNLQYLHVGRTSCEDMVKFSKLMLNNKSTLHTVSIDGILSPGLLLELPVRNPYHLTSFSLSNVTMKHENLDNLVKYLSENVTMENIRLARVHCDKNQCRVSDCAWTLNLHMHKHLAFLYLYHVPLSCTNINSSSIKSIVLGPERHSLVSMEMDPGSYFNIFNSIKESNLEHLHFYHLIGEKTMRTLTAAVKTLTCLKLLVLYKCDIPNDVLLELNDNVRYVEIKLNMVTMTKKCFHYFIDSLVNKKSVIKVWLYKCTITSECGDHRGELSYSKAVEYMAMYLASIPTVINKHKVVSWSLEFETTGCN